MCSSSKHRTTRWILSQAHLAVISPICLSGSTKRNVWKHFRIVSIADQRSGWNSAHLSVRSIERRAFYIVESARCSWLKPLPKTLLSTFEMILGFCSFQIARNRRCSEHHGPAQMVLLSRFAFYFYISTFFRLQHFHVSPFHWKVFRPLLWNARNLTKFVPQKALIRALQRP